MKPLAPPASIVPKIVSAGRVRAPVARKKLDADSPLSTPPTAGRPALQNCTAATFKRAMAVCFVGHKELQGSQQKGPEPALFRVSAIEISPFQHAHEEILREVLRLIGRITTPAQIGVQRIPVAFALRN